MNRFVAVAAAATLVAGPALARDQVSIAGSSTVRPYAEIVAEAFGNAFPQFNAVVEGGGSSGGLRRFCEGVGTEFIDIANASRSIRPAEIEACAANGVTDVMEIRFGYDGIVFAFDVDGPSMAMEPADVFLALGEKIAVDGAVVDNPNQTLADVNDAFPSWDIAFYPPASNHGTREVFEEKVLIPGCEASGAMEAYMASGMDEDAAEEQCKAMRTDGKVTEIAGDYTETLARLDANQTGVGVFGLAFYENNTDKLQVATMSGVTPSQASVASGEYPVSRPLFFYVKKAHIGVVPGLQEYVNFFISEAMTGPNSPTVNYGLVASPENERTAVRAAFANGETL